MNILGIGPAEMGIIAVAALLIFGPGKLPEVMGQAGKLVRDFRRMSAELTGEFEKTIAEAKDVGASISKEVGGMSSQVNSVANSVKKDLGVKGSASKAKPGVGAKTTAASKLNAKSGAKASTSTAAKSSTSAASKSSGASAKSTSTSTTTSTTARATTAAKKPALPVASREDPAADISLFEPVVNERPRRSRRATPSVIADPTPRADVVERRSLTSADQPTSEQGRSADPIDEALARARARRRSAQYGQRSTPPTAAVG